MRGLTVQIFDNYIVGSAGTWYTSAEFNDLLTKGDAFAIQGVTMAVSGSSPTVTVRLEQSEDTENWVQESTPVINGQSISNGASFGNFRLGVDPVISSFARFKITMAGTNPKCRLKLFVTLRSYRPANGQSTAQSAERHP